MIRACPAGFVFVFTWPDASAVLVAAALSYTFSHILMHIYKTREDVRDDTGKSYLKLLEVNQILNRQAGQ